MNLSKLLAVALLAPVVAFAAPAGSKTTTKSTPAKPPPASTGSTSAMAGSPLEGLEVGGFLGYETDDLSGFSLRVDGEVPFRQLSPQVKMSLVGSLGYSRLTWEPFPNWKFTANVIKLVPAARFTLPLNEQFSVFGDAGLGLAYVSAKVEFDAPFGGGNFSGSDSSLNLMMRLGAGAWYHVNPQLKVGAMLEFDPVFGDYGYAGNGISGGQNTFLIQVGGMFKI